MPEFRGAIQKNFHFVRFSRLRILTGGNRAIKSNGPTYHQATIKLSLQTIINYSSLRF